MEATNKETTWYVMWRDINVVILFILCLVSLLDGFAYPIFLFYAFLYFIAYMPITMFIFDYKGFKSFISDLWLVFKAFVNKPQLNIISFLKELK